MIRINSKCSKQLELIPDDIREVLIQQTLESKQKKGTVRYNDDDKKYVLSYFKDDSDCITFDEILNMPLALLEDSQLQNMGVPEGFLELTRSADSFEEIRNLPLDVEVKDKLERWFVSCRKKVECSHDGVCFVSDTVDHLDRFYRKDITRLLLLLHEDQEVLVNRQVMKSPVIVKGSVGSGKTTIALYRMLKYAKMGKNVLYITYNKSLKMACETLIRELEGEIPPGVTILTSHGLCRKLLHDAGKKTKIIGVRNWQKDILERAIAVVAKSKSSLLYHRSEEFWFKEFNDVIKGRCFGDKQAYLKVDRIGRGTALDSKAREVVWAVYMNYENCKKKTYGSKLDYSDLLVQAYRLLESTDDFFKYDMVFVDEAQDLSKIAMEIAVRVCVDPGALFIVADAAQSIYQQGFRWKDLGITVASQSVIPLKKNHRNTREILEAAQCLLENDEEFFGSEELIVPEMSSKNGPKPVIRADFKSITEQIEWVVQDIVRRVESGECIEKNIAVLSKEKKYTWVIAGRLEAQGIKAFSYVESIDLSDNSVKCVTLHSGKGLEFPVVYLVGIDNNIIPCIKDPEESDEELLVEKKLLYVGMTRAMNELIILCNRHEYSDFLDEIDEECVLRSDKKDFLVSLAEAYENDEEYAEAIDSWQQLSILDMNNPHVWYSMAWNYLMLESYDETISHCKLALQLNDEDENYHHLIGLAYFNKKDYSKALFWFKKAYDLNPENDEIKSILDETCLLVD